MASFPGSSSFASPNEYFISNNYGLEHGKVLARIVPLDKDRFNRSGFMQYTLHANPGYMLLLPLKSGGYRLEGEGVRQGTVNSLQLKSLQRKDSAAIEVLNGNFVLKQHVRCNYGFNHTIGKDELVDFDACFNVSIRNLDSFFARFPLNRKDAISINQVQQTIQGDLCLLSASSIDRNGYIDQRTVRHIYNSYGLYLHGNPIIEGYRSTLEEHLAKLRQEVEEEIAHAQRAAIQDSNAIQKHGLTVLQQLLTELVKIEATPEKIDQVLKRVGEYIESTCKAIRQAHMQGCGRAQQRLQDFSGRYRPDKRPDHQFRKANSLPDYNKRPALDHKHDEQRNHLRNNNQMDYNFHIEDALWDGSAPQQGQYRQQHARSNGYGHGGRVTSFKGNIQSPKKPHAAPQNYTARHYSGVSGYQTNHGHYDGNSSRRNGYAGYKQCWDQK